MATTTPTTTVARTIPIAATTPPLVAVAPAGATLIATTHGTIDRYGEPGGAPDGTIPGLWYGGVSALPVIAQKPGWLEVRLAQRPNESTAWVQAADVTVSSTPYRIVVDLGTAHLELWKSGHELYSFPAGVGTMSDPTTPGHFFLALYSQSPSAGYGPYVMVTSAHSNAITDWDESGDALIAIHGPLGEDGLIGNGARISHGCIRLHDADLALLGAVPAGAPIDIVA